MPERGEVITLVDEGGKTHEFSLVDVIEVDARRYAILQPVLRGVEGPVDAEEAAVLFRVEDDTLVTIEEEDEFDRVVEALEASADYDDVSLLDLGRDDDDGADDADHDRRVT